MKLVRTRLSVRSLSNAAELGLWVSKETVGKGIDTHVGREVSKMTASAMLPKELRPNPVPMCMVCVPQAQG